MGQLSGMTGFARATGEHDGLNWVWETRSVNGKGLEARFRLPPGYERLEAKARELTKARFARGNIQASLNIRIDSSVSGLKINTDRIDFILETVEPYIASGRVLAPRLDGLLAVRGVLDMEEQRRDEDTSKQDALIMEGLAKALDDLKLARHAEGDALKPVLVGHVDEIERLSAQAASSDAMRTETIKARIAAKFAELLPEGLPEDRLVLEAATMAVKMDIREELDRLIAHIVSARELLDAGSPTGRKLDFLSQEFNREANTLCSKSADSALTQIGLAIKNAIDQLREQVQNVE